MSEASAEELPPSPPLLDEPPTVRVVEWSAEVVVGTDKGKRVITQDALIRVGLDVTNDLVLTDPTVSRRHVELERTPNGILLRDLGSRNGTLVEGRRVKAVFLESGDRVDLGKTKVLIKVEPKPLQLAATADDRLGELVGGSEPMRVLFAALQRLAAEDGNVLIEGEPGAGKDAVARTLHALSARKAQPLRQVDCVGLQEDSTERELFRGLDEGGTLLLDHVHALPLPLQLRLVRVLESGQLPSEGAQPRPISVRLLSLTSRNLAEEVRIGTFHSELAFRLQAGRLRVPPLRVRKEDLSLLGRAFLSRAHQQRELNPQTLSLLESYEWPGNVRELRQVLERGAWV